MSTVNCTINVLWPSKLQPQTTLRHNMCPAATNADFGSDGAACIRAQNPERGRWTWQARHHTNTQPRHMNWVSRTKELVFTNISHTGFDFRPACITQPFLLFWFDFSTIRKACSCIYIGNSFQTHDRHRVFALKFFAYFHLTIAGECTFHLWIAMCSTTFFSWCS